MLDLNSGHAFKDASFKNYIQFKSFAWLYEQLFETITAESDSLKEKAFRIRYEVFCEEFGYEEAERYADKLEKDTYDEDAMHSLLIHKRSGEAIGTVRVIKPNLEQLESSFPVQEMFSCGRLRDQISLQHMCEISRLCVLKQFRSRHGDEGSPLGSVHDQDKETFMDRSCRRVAKRIIPFAPIGLVSSAFEMAISQGLSKSCAIMETRLISALERLGIICERIGPVIDFHGERQPVIIDFYKTSNNMRLHQKAVWDVFTNYGQLHDEISKLREKQKSIPAS